jgi:serine/threonine protein kinase/Tol biopolymer transport system component
MSIPPSLGPGARIGPYEIVALLGEGGMGQVYRARDERLSREVALKVVHADLAQDAEWLKRFEHEAKAAGALDHPNIVAVYDTGQSGRAPYIVTELLQGETLRDRLATGSLGVRKAVDYGIQIARGLAAAHEKGIVHRDLKPGNLFLTKDGFVKILDFGIAKLGHAGEEHAGTDATTLADIGTNPGTMLGTVGYMSPEQVRGLPADHRSDLFSFGVVLFEMLTGKRAFKGTTAADTLSAILREDPTDSTTNAAGIPPALLRVVRRCLEKRPDDRFQSARDLAFAVEGATTASGVAAPATLSPTKRRRLVASILGSALLLAVAGIGLWLGRRASPPWTPPTFQKLTFRIGGVASAVFAPDGETILYSASWGKSPIEVFSTRAATRGSRPLGLTDAIVLAVSSREELAFLVRPRPSSYVFEGTLARAPMAGGTPREVLEGVLDADWSPDGKDLAVIHVVGDQYRLEYPIGKVLYEPEPPTWLADLRVSPGGDRVAFVEHPVPRDQRGQILLVGTDGHKRALASGFTAVYGTSWSPDASEVWFNATRASGAPHQIRAVSLAGRERLLYELAGNFGISDVSRRGQLLGLQLSGETQTRARGRGAIEEAELPAADMSYLSDLSDDGAQILGTDTGEGGGPSFSFYVQKTDGSAPVWLGEGDGQSISPDGRRVLAVLHAKPEQLIVVPTGAGETRTLEPGPIVRYSRAVWDPTGRRVVFSGFDGNDVERVYLQDVDGGPPRAVTTEDVSLPRIGRPVSPDARRVVALGPDGLPALYPSPAEILLRSRASARTTFRCAGQWMGESCGWPATTRRRRASSVSTSPAGARGPGTGSDARPPAA